MFGANELNEWHRRVFLLSNKYGLAPSEIDDMPYFDFKMYLILFNMWREETSKGQ